MPLSQKSHAFILTSLTQPFFVLLEVFPDVQTQDNTLHHVAGGIIRIHAGSGSGSDMQMSLKQLQARSTRSSGLRKQPGNVLDSSA